MATIKLGSSHPILDKEQIAADYIYYIISSEPVLKLLYSHNQK